MADNPGRFDDFMIEEYDHIASAYFGLRGQITEMFKAYLTLVALPLTVLVAVVDRQTVSIASLPDVVSGLLLVVALLGLLVALIIISMRMSMIRYARTINGVRRYFAERGQGEQSSPGRSSPVDYLILPTTDAKPSFFEKWRAVFWQIAMIGLLDAVLCWAAVQSLWGVFWLSIGLGVLYAALHLAAYWGMARSRERAWHTHFGSGLGPSDV